MKWSLKHIMLGLIMVVLFLPLIQTTFHFSKIKKLSGDYVPASNTPITKNLWFSKEFQEKKERYLTDHFGYRTSYIRIYNQVSYYLFKKAKANGVAIGKENYLFEQGYIDAYYGLDYAGPDSITKKCVMLSMLNDTLTKLNKTLLLVFAPNKAAFYPEYIPIQPYSPKGITNIEVYLRLTKQMNIKTIDFYTWFNKNKDTSPYPLFPKYGTHWSQYGAYIAMDSLLRKIESLRGIDIPQPVVKEIQMASVDDTDRDIERGMNLWYGLDAVKLGKPYLEYEPSEHQKKLSSIIVGDSFFWQMISYGISNSFSKSQFWYYFKESHEMGTSNSPRKISEMNISTEIDSADIIILMASDMNIPQLGWGFIDSAYYKYYKKAPDNFTFNRKQQISQIMKDISADPSWMKSIREKAAVKKISVDSMLYIDALWVMDQK